MYSRSTVKTTESSGRAEREAALTMIRRTCRRGSTVGADRGYDTQDFVSVCRKLGVAPHVVRKRLHSAVDGRVARGKSPHIDSIEHWALDLGSSG